MAVQTATTNFIVPAKDHGLVTILALWDEALSLLGLPECHTYQMFPPHQW